MSFLRRIFGTSSRELAWRRAAELLGARYVTGRRLSPDVVQLKVGHAIVTLDTEAGGDDGPTYTRLRAPYVNPDGFRFEIYRRTMFSRIGVALGMQDIIVGDDSFDDDFVIKSNSELGIRNLLSEERIRGLLRIQQHVHFGVTDGGSVFKKFPDRVDELHFRAPVVITEVDRIVHLFELFQEVLPKLMSDERVGEDEVTQRIRQLRGPGGTILDRGIIRWSGNEALYEAAERLGELGDARAVGALVSAMNRGDLALTAKSVMALGKIGNKRAVRSLVPLLGDDGVFDGRPLRVWVAEALDEMGEGVLASAFLRALQGDPEGLRASVGPYRPQVLRALLTCLSGAAVRQASDALVRLEAVEVLTQMRAILRTLYRDDHRKRNPSLEALAVAIRELEARSALPRPADAPEPTSETLPRPAGEPDLGAADLPRPADGPTDDARDDTSEGEE